MQIAIAIGLFVIAILLFVAAWLKLIGDRVLDLAVKIAAIVSALGAIVLFLVPSAAPTLPTERMTPTPIGPTPIATTTIATQPIEPVASPTGESVMMTRTKPAPSAPSPPTVILPTPTTSLPASTTTSPVPIKEYGMPRSGGKYLVFDTSLRVVYGDRLVKLDLIENEGRFKTADSIPLGGSSIAWDVERRQYWSVRDAAGSCGLELIDLSGDVTATYLLPEDIRCLGWIAWDGDYLFGSEGQTIYKLQPSSAGGMLQLVDSYAPAVHSFPDQSVTGLTWDGEHLWVLAEDALARLDEGGRPACRLQVHGGPRWWGYEGLVWDGRWLWVAYPDANTVYRVDPSGCR